MFCLDLIFGVGVLRSVDDLDTQPLDLPPPLAEEDLTLVSQTLDL